MTDGPPMSFAPTAAPVTIASQGSLVFSRDDILTWVMLYWVSGCIGTSFAPYPELAERPAPTTVRTGVTIFPGDLVPAPQAFAESVFDVRDWKVEPDGGQFGAWERPEAYAAGLRRAIALANG